MRNRIIFICISTFIMLIAIFSCFYYKDNIRFKIDYEIYNNVAFSNGKTISVGIDVNNKVKYVDEDDLENILTTGTSVIYFGYSTCPWCRNIVSPLIDVVNNSDIDTLYYVDAKNVNTKGVFDILEEYLEVDENNNKRLYVPDVYFIKSGEIMFHHIGTIDGYKNAFKGMSEDELKELKNIYQEGIVLIEDK